MTLRRRLSRSQAGTMTIAARAPQMTEHAIDLRPLPAFGH
jgi:hypothetical protein